MQTALNTRSAGEQSSYPLHRVVYMIAVDHDCDGRTTHVKRAMVPESAALDSFDAISLAYRSDDGAWMQAFEPSEITILSHAEFYGKVARYVDTTRVTWQRHGFGTFRGEVKI